MTELKTKETLISPIISQIEAMGLNDVCFACGEEVVKCDHLCRTCDAILGGASKCPFCNTNSIGRRIKALWVRISPEMRAQVTKVLEEIQLQPSEEFIPTYESVSYEKKKKVLLLVKVLVSHNCSDLLKVPNELFAAWFEKEAHLMSDPASVVAQYIVSAIRTICVVFRPSNFSLLCE